MDQDELNTMTFYIPTITREVLRTCTKGELAAKPGPRTYFCTLQLIIDLIDPDLQYTQTGPMQPAADETVSLSHLKTTTGMIGPEIMNKLGARPCV